ncbi:hypothetical protein NDA11_004878 [Ustilago hordei]|nr:hypothetical protein NDA11_004878 [Ustilago hordei]
MGPLHSATQYSFVLIIHDAHSSMIWVQGLAHKGATYQEAAWWLSKIHATKNQRLSEVWVDQGELWSAAFCELCSSMGMKISASPTQQQTPLTTGICVSAGTTTIYSREGELAFNRNVSILYSDSSGAHAIASDPQHFKRTKHIDIAHFFLQDEVASQ